MHLKVGCQPPYSQKKKPEGGEIRNETNSVYPFICGLIFGVEDVVNFR
jgi:hypothetical protein